MVHYNDLAKVSLFLGGCGYLGLNIIELKVNTFVKCPGNIVFKNVFFYDNTFFKYYITKALSKGAKIFGVIYFYPTIFNDQ